MVVALCFLFSKQFGTSYGSGETSWERYYYQEDYERIPRIDPDEFPERSTILLSDLLEDFQVVHLDSENADAMLGQYIRTTLSDSYIGIQSSSPHSPFRLHDRKTGAFIRKIGSIGRGPGEYIRLLYDWVIDEKNDRIYLVPFAESRILEYTLSGDYLGDISVSHLVSEGKKMMIDVRDSIFTAFVLPFRDDTVAACAFTRTGRVISVTTNPFGGADTYDNEIHVNKGHSASGYTATNCPIYYRYDHATDSLYALFGLAMDEENPRLPDWLLLPYEGPNFFLFQVFHIVQKETPTRKELERPRDYWLLVDKQTGERSAGELINDYLGNIETTNSSYPDKYGKDHSFTLENGYYMEIISAVALKRLLGDAIAKNEMSAEVRNRVESLYASFEETDNHFLFYGKLKSN